jgi:hypothetical protein
MRFLALVALPPSLFLLFFFFFLIHCMTRLQTTPSSSSIPPHPFQNDPQEYRTPTSLLSFVVLPLALAPVLVGERSVDKKPVNSREVSPTVRVYCCFSSWFSSTRR